MLPPRSAVYACAAKLPASGVKAGKDRKQFRKRVRARPGESCSVIQPPRSAVCACAAKLPASGVKAGNKESIFGGGSGHRPAEVGPGTARRRWVRT